MEKEWSGTVQAEYFDVSSGSLACPDCPRSGVIRAHLAVSVGSYHFHCR